MYLQGDNSEIAQASKSFLACQMCCNFCMQVLWIILFGVYAFNNPDVNRYDGEHCYAPTVLNESDPVYEPISADSVGAIDVTNSYLEWF